MAEAGTLFKTQADTGSRQVSVNVLYFRRRQTVTDYTMEALRAAIYPYR